MWPLVGTTDSFYCNMNLWTSCGQDKVVRLNWIPFVWGIVVSGYVCLCEGEKLSKQELQSNGIIKKLRQRERQNDQLLAAQRCVCVCVCVSVCAYVHACVCVSV